MKRLVLTFALIAAASPVLAQTMPTVCDSEAFVACGDTCNDKFPNNREARLGCISGCGIATGCG